MKNILGTYWLRFLTLTVAITLVGAGCVPDARARDTDRDGIPDSVDSAPNDHDNDGSDDLLDADDDNDGINDDIDTELEDHDNDGTDDAEDTDDNNDKLSDDEESDSLDTDDDEE
jgi:hypothetical protein